MLPPISTWATATNYPAGGNPWSGLPTKVAPSYTFWTPGLPITAQELNYIVSSATQGAQLAIESALDNWSAGVNATSLTASAAFQAACWDPLLAKWWAVATATSTPKVYDSVDGGRTWNAVVSSPPTATTNVCSIATSGTGILVWIATGNTLGNSLSSLDAAGTTHALSAANQDNGTVFWYPAAGKFVSVGGSQSGGTFSGLAFTTSGTSAPVAVTTSLPAAWQTSTNHIVAHLSAVGNGDVLVAAQATTAGTDTTRLLHVTFPSSTLTFTDITPAVVASRAITAVAWDSVNSLWLIMSADNTGSNYKLHYSADLTNWTLAFTFSSSSLFGLAVVGGIWCAMFKSPDVAHSTLARVYLSNDLGASWHATASGLQYSGQTFFPQSLVAGGNGLFAAHSGTAYLSWTAGLT